MEDVFVEALRFLYTRALEKEGIQADVLITRKEIETDCSGGTYERAANL